MTYGTQEDLLQSWGFKIRTGAGEREFASIFGRCMMESERDDFSTLKEEDRNALLNSCISSDREMPDAEVDRNADTYDTSFFFPSFFFLFFYFCFTSILFFYLFIYLFYLFIYC